MTRNIPYFMSDKKWYFFDKNEWCYKLTKKAPKEAIESYNDFYNKNNKKEELSNGILKKINYIIT